MIGSRNLAVTCPARTPARRADAVPPVNKASGLGASRREAGERQVRKTRGRRNSDQIFRDHAPAPVLALQTSGEILVGLQCLGEQERLINGPSAYEAASRYEDRQFEDLAPGAFGRKLA